MTMMPERRIHA